ncbi:MAG: glycosyltransferase [Bacteroidota bacterium]|nr:glycosyltransferase [Bacteroidota bacterium]
MILERDFPPDLRVENEISALTEQGIEVHVACYTFSKKNSLESYNGYTIHRKKISSFTYKSSVGALKLPFYFKFWKSFVSKLCKEYKFDAIHVHDLPLAEPVYQIAKKFDLKSIIDLHENWPFHLMETAHTKKLFAKLIHNDDDWVRYEETQLKHFNAVITVVEEMKNRIQTLGANNVFVYQNVPNLNDFDLSPTQFMKRDDIVRFIYVGGINENRGIQHTLEGFKLLLKDYTNISYEIVGNGPYLSHLKRLSKHLGIEEKVHFHGWKKQQEAYELMKAADICVIPHIRSVQTDCSSPNKLFQYYIQKKPVISSNCTSIERVLNETKGGKTYTDQSPESFAGVAKEYLENRDSILLDGLNGYNSVIERYNLEFEKTEIIKAYQKLGLC